MPSITLTERLADWHQGSAIDSAARIVRNVALTGLHSRNGYRYTESAPDDASRRELIRERLELLQHVARHLPSSHSRQRENPALDRAACLQAFRRR